MLLVSPIPGQEERNADYLLEAGAAIKAVDGATLVFKLGAPARGARTAARDERGGAQNRHAAGGRRRGCANIRGVMKPSPSDVCRFPSAGARRSRPRAGRPRTTRADTHASRALGGSHRARRRAQSASHHAHAVSQRAAHGARACRTWRSSASARSSTCAPSTTTRTRCGARRCAPSAPRSSPGASTTNTSSR